MKKIFALVLVVVMMASLAVSAVAAPIISVTDPANKSSQDITIKVEEGQVITSTVYSVDIVWTNTYLEVETKVTKTWDPTTHTYDESYDTDWAGKTVNVEVTNHSNAAVVATLAVPAEKGGISFTPDKTVANLDTAVDTAVAEAPKDTFTITPSGNVAPGTNVTATATVTITTTP